VASAPAMGAAIPFRVRPFRWALAMWSVGERPRSAKGEASGPSGRSTSTRASGSTAEGKSAGWSVSRSDNDVSRSGKVIVACDLEGVPRTAKVQMTLPTEMYQIAVDAHARARMVGICTQVRAVVKWPPVAQRDGRHRRSGSVQRSARCSALTVAAPRGSSIAFVDSLRSQPDRRAFTAEMPNGYRFTEDRRGRSLVAPSLEGEGCFVARLVLVVIGAEPERDECARVVLSERLLQVHGAAGGGGKVRHTGPVHIGLVAAWDRQRRCCGRRRRWLLGLLRVACGEPRRSAMWKRVWGPYPEFGQSLE
jgi:hypothetical protein